MKTEKQGEAEETVVVDETVTEEVVVDEVDEDVPWMQDEEPDSEEEDGVDGDDDVDVVADEDSVSVAKHIKVKQKLKGRVKEEKEENARLLKRIEELEKGEPTTQAANAPEIPKRPRREDFTEQSDFDDAIDVHELALVNYVPVASASQADQKQKQADQTKEVEDALDGHVDRAAKLIEKHGIDPDVYEKAQDNVKKLIAESFPNGKKPGASDFIYNQFLNLIGEGSEKTIFYVGKNKAAGNEFERLIRSDPTGLKTAFYLGSVNTEIAGKKNLTSRASKPTTKLKGGTQVPANAAAAQKRYKAAHKKGDGQLALETKRKARKAGIDVSSW